MKFTQSWSEDLRAVARALRDRVPFAFARFGDGEFHICNDMPHAARSDGWRHDESQGDLRRLLLESVSYSEPGYYVGISACEHHADAHGWYRKVVSAPLGRVTYAELFSLGNYAMAKELISPRQGVLVAPGGDISVGATPKTWGDVDAMAGQLGHGEEPVLVAAGPWGKVLVYRLWASYRRTAVDVGSLFDEQRRGRRTRAHHRRGHWKSTWFPNFHRK